MVVLPLRAVIQRGGSASAGGSTLRRGGPLFPRSEPETVCGGRRGGDCRTRGVRATLRAGPVSPLTRLPEDVPSGRGLARKVLSLLPLDLLQRIGHRTADVAVFL